jgi:hypothetical protein
MLNISTHPLHQLTNDIYKCRKQSISINDKLFKQLNQLHFGLIITNAIFSFVYAEFIKCGKFEEGESVISKSAYWSFYYAIYVIKCKFPLGEPAIYSKPYLVTDYTRFLLKLK